MFYFKIPKGEKERIKEAASGMEMSVNEYLFALVCDDLVGKTHKHDKRMSK